MGTNLGSLRPHGRGSITRCRRINKGSDEGRRIGGSSEYIRGGVYLFYFYFIPNLFFLGYLRVGVYRYCTSCGLCDSSGVVHI